VNENERPKTTASEKRMTIMTSNTSSPSQPAMSMFWENVRTIVYALILAMGIRFAVAQPFRIPSGSMQPTLQVGDYIVVTKWSYGYGRYSMAPFDMILPAGRIMLFGHLPRRGDVIVFRPPPDPQRDFIKRLIGLPGDRIQMINDVLYINGQAVPREQVGATRDCPEPDGSTTDVPVYRETLPNGVSYTTCDKTPVGELDNTRVFTVPEGHYFMMGDDRDNSADSRTPTVGYVPFDNMIGPAQFIVASFDSTTSIFQPWTLISGFRGNRFLKPVR
jgi:signal peptidase I